MAALVPVLAPCARIVVLVEGHSDRVAVQTLATRADRDLAAEGVEVVAMGGITNTYAHLVRCRTGATVVGLYDAAEERHVRGALARAGRGDLDRAALATAGFFGCEPDLEHELIRALGTDAVEAVIERAGESRSLRSLAGMPAQRDWTREDVLHRFLGVRAGRKARYARLLVEALAPQEWPAPMKALFAEF